MFFQKVWVTVTLEMTISADNLGPLLGADSLRKMVRKELTKVNGVLNEQDLQIQIVNPETCTQIIRRD